MQEKRMSGDSQLIGTWQAQDIGGRPLRDDVASTIGFGSDGRVAGNAGVNRFGGSYRIEGDAIELGPFFSTRMAGPEPAMRQEQDFLITLSGRRPFAVDGEALVIGEGPEQVRLLRVDEAPRAAT
jgi:heat shock protein HslJ